MFDILIDLLLTKLTANRCTFFVNEQMQKILNKLLPKNAETLIKIPSLDTT